MNFGDNMHIVVRPAFGRGQFYAGILRRGAGAVALALARMRGRFLEDRPAEPDRADERMTADSVVDLRRVSAQIRRCADFHTAPRVLL